MRRLLLAIVVGLLTFSATGLVGLVVNEPCTTYERPGQEDGACPPTCVTCGCCGQAANIVSLVLAVTPDIRVADASQAMPSPTQTTPRGILHVPKLRFA